MPLVVPGVARFSYHGTLGPRPWATVLDFHITSGGIGGRNDNVKDQAKVLLNEWIDEIRAFMANNVVLQGCSWVDLDSTGGTTGDAVAADSPRTMPSSGTSATDMLPPNVALLIRKNVAAGRGKRKGRWYLPGLVESSNADGVPLAADVTTVNTALATYLSAVNQSGATSFGGYDSELVVVHQPSTGSPSFDHVDSLVAQPVWATQRRRARG